MGAFDDIAPPASSLDDIPPPTVNTPYTPKSPIQQQDVGTGENFNRAWHQKTNYTPQQLQKAQQGVDVDFGLPSAVSMNPTFGFTPKDSMSRNNLMMLNLQDHFSKAGYPFDISKDIRRSTVDGKMEYFNPITHNWTETSYPIGAALGDALPAAGGIAGGLAGGIGGMAAGGPALSSAAGYTGQVMGQAGGEYIRREIGRLMGYNPESELDALRGAGGEGWDMAKWGAIFGVAGRTGKYVKWRINKQGPIDPDVATDLYRAYEDNKDFVNDFNKLRSEGTPPIKPDIGQMTNDPVALGMKASINKGTAHAATIRPQDQQNQTTLRNIWDNTVYGKDSPPPTPEAANANRESVQGTIEAAKNSFADPYASKISDLQDKLNAASMTGRTQDALQLTDDIRGFMEEQKTAAMSTAQVKDAVLAQTKGNRPFTMVLDDDIKGLFNQNEAAGDSALFSFQKWLTRKLVPDLLPENVKVSLDSVDKAITDLGIKADQASSGIATGQDYTVSQIWQTRQALKDFRSRYLGKTNPDLAKAYAERDAAWNQYESTWNRNFLGKLLEKNTDGLYTLNGKDAMAQVLNRKDLPAYDQFTGLLKQMPQAQNLVKQLFLGQYDREATAQGIGIPKLHDAFMANYGDAMEGVFSKSEMDYFRNRGDMASQLADSTQAMKRIGRKFADNFGVDIGSLNSNTIVNRFFGKDPQRWSSVYDASKMADTELGTNMAGGMENIIRDKLHASVLDSNGGVTIEGLSKLAEPTTYANIQKVFGIRYAYDVKQVGEMARMLGRTGQEIDTAGANSSVGTKFLRIITGVMSPEGRAVTAVSGVKDARYANFIHDILYNPDKLHEFATSVLGANRRSNAARMFSDMGFNANQWPDNTTMPRSNNGSN